VEEMEIEHEPPTGLRGEKPSIYGLSYVMEYFNYLTLKLPVRYHRRNRIYYSAVVFNSAKAASTSRCRTLDLSDENCDQLTYIPEIFKI
jgi:hypothetical protein